MWLFIKTYPFKYWSWYLAGLIALILTTFITTLIPIEIMQIIDSINTNSDWLQLKPNVIRLISLAGALAIVRTLSRILIFTPGRYVEYDLRKTIHRHLLTLSPEFFRTHTIGDTMSRMINDIQALRLMSAFGFLHIVNTTMIYSLVIYQMIHIHPELTSWVLIPVPFALLVIRLFVKRLYKITKQSQQQLGQITDFFVESVANISLVKT
ncbi:MAG: ABC transporter transmembrane domain-containing protein, partial [Candidatus Margulisiibacteriota bacterium]|nr:ABC transporter transmembrane domain-containing protein [Candidatus Margulisiibacteriota bacterium]